ncbi:WD40 repeat-like protein [Serendipita vermifera]|nr:WD40 repeat-like protein [Serendipita vermifera]
MSGVPGEQSPQNDTDEPMTINGVPINQLSGRDLDQLAAAVLKERGYADIAATIQARSGGLVSGVQAQPPITSAEFVNKHLPRTKSTGENPFDKPGVVVRLANGLTHDPTGRNRSTPPTSSLTAMKDGGATQLLQGDPLNRQEAFRDLQAWVEGSLDMYKPEFRPLLFPIFVHFYLDLVQENYLEGARMFLRRFYSYFSMNHRVTLDRLSALTMPIHVAQSELARRFREEKYVCRLSKSGKDLLLGWLTDGVGGEDIGSGTGIIGGERAKAGRDQVLKVINNNLYFHVTSSHSLTISPNVWEESTGLISNLVPPKPEDADVDMVTTNGTAAEEFNAANSGLKLGIPGPEGGLREEVEKVLQEDQMHSLQMSNAPIPHHLTTPDLRSLIPPPSNGHPIPNSAELPPMPPNFRTIDIKREVERVRDIRRRIKLDTTAFNAMERKEFSMNGFDQRQVAARQKALPSICCYTFRDAPEGVSSSTFSADSTLLAAGFSESYIRLWSVKGEKLRALRSDFDLSEVKDVKDLRERHGTTTRKLIGHSGPVYGLSFDPTGGSAVPPRFLLSSSADGTARLWSLDTMTNVVAYRGHSKPVWDVEWSPRGIYFATGSRDQTARLWTSDRVSPLRIFAGHLGDVDCIRFHPNSLYLATGSSDCTCRLWDVQTGSCVRVFLGHQGPVTAMATSPDGKYLASAGEDLAINLWDLGTGKRVKKMTGHTATIYSLAFSQETSVLVSGAADWTVRCWDVKSAGGLAPKTSTAGNNEENAVDAFGFPKKPPATTAGTSEVEREEEDNFVTRDLMETFPTKRTPILNVQFTPRNLCLVAGYMQSSVGTDVSFERR